MPQELVSRSRGLKSPPSKGTVRRVGYPNTGSAVSPLEAVFWGDLSCKIAPSLALTWGNVIAEVSTASQEVQFAKWKRAKVALKDTLYHT